MRAFAPMTAALVVLVTAGLGACTEEPTGAIADDSLVLRDYLISEGFAFTSTVDGVRNADVVADSAWTWQDSTATYLFGVQMNFFDSLGVASARLTSQEARLDAETQDLVATGNAVLLVLAMDYRIQSPELYYSPEQNEIRSDTVTSAQMDGDLLTGTRFRSDLQFQNVEITSPLGAIPRMFMDTAQAAPSDARNAAGTGNGDPEDEGR